MDLGLVAVTISLNLIYQGFSVGSDFWLSMWSTAVVAKDDPNRKNKEYFYLIVYALLGVSGGNCRWASATGFSLVSVLP